MLSQNYLRRFFYYRLRSAQTPELTAGDAEGSDPQMSGFPGAINRRSAEKQKGFLPNCKE
jgi:hypothetical protein|tara:strand:+ start:142 stop:321 length:180 start_codon:yes stop_codon:yes gene_type:complete